MNIRLLPIALLFFFNDVLAQDTEFKYAVKLYNLTTVEQTELVKGRSGPYSQRNWEERISILHPTIAFQWRAKGNNFHEVELTNFKWDNTTTVTELINDTTGQMQQVIGGSTINSTHLSARYEYGITFGSMERKLIPAIGIGVETYYRRHHYTAVISTISPFTDQSMGAAFYLIPRLTQRLSERLSLDVNIPVRISNTYLHTVHTADHRLAEDQRRVNTIAFDMFPGYFSGRIGLVLKV